MSTPEQLLGVLEDITKLLQKTQINLKKCPKQRLTRRYIEARIKCIQEYWNNFTAAHMDLIKGTTRESRQDISHFVNEHYFICEDLYLIMLADLNDLLLTSSNTSAPTSSPNQSELFTSQLRLPKIELPKFTGHYEEWATFHDLFVSLVHKNTSLSDVQKLHYLKSSIGGEAQALLKYIQITDSNYSQAWSVLQQRYGNKRLIVKAVLKRLFNQRKINTQSSSQIKSLLDTTNECLNNLNNMSINTESWDPLIIFLVVQKLDQDTHKDWEEYSYEDDSKELLTGVTLKKFLESKFRTLELVSPGTAAPVREKPKERTFAAIATTTSEKTCVKCEDNHTLCHCKQFTEMNVKDRNEYVKEKRLCYNCLLPGHSVFKCRVPLNCRVCNKRHHSLLHEKKENTYKTQQDTQDTTATISGVSVNHAIEGKSETTLTMTAHCNKRQGTALLATAMVTVKSEEGHIIVLRALIDQGSEACFISEKAAQLLKLKRQPIRGTVIGVASTKTDVKQVVQLQVLSRRENNFCLNIQAYVMSKQLTAKIPQHTITIYNDFQDTSVLVMHHQVDVEDMLKTLWEIDTESKRKYTQEEELCENIYKSTHARNEEGRYIVKLPFKTKNPKSPDGNTRDIAMRRLLQLERKFIRQPDLKEAYGKVMEDYITLNHMAEVPVEEINTKKAVYLPHHAVIRSDKETTKTRVVYDASCKGSNGISLNDELLIGPLVQDDLRSILMRWRMHAICFVADIEKMYRMVLVTKDDVDYQRILWRNDAADEVKDYRLLTVTFGTAPAPFLSCRTLIQLANDEGKNYPVAASMISDYYVDDILSGKDTVDGAIHASQQLKGMMRKGGFLLKKWSSNSVEFMKSISPDERSSNAQLDLNIDGKVKALGILWDLNEDKIEYKFTLQPIEGYVTKRSILSDVQKLYDPLGWLSPSIIMAKIFIQKLWLERVNWDDQIDEGLADEWLRIRSDFDNINCIHVDRWLHTYNEAKINIQLHGYSDASSRAYASAVYVRVICPNGNIHTDLVAARTRVAPLKTVSVPRLELCGALLLSQLLKHVGQAMSIPKSQTFAWTDSSIVLAWLSGEPSRWKTFVANRVVETLENVNSNQWYHVQSQENPADIASRGMSIQELTNCKLWRKGPNWLTDKEIQFTRLNNVQTHVAEKSNNEIKTY